MTQNLVHMAGVNDFLGDPEDLEEILRDVNITAENVNAGNNTEVKPSQYPPKENEEVYSSQSKQEVQYPEKKDDEMQVIDTSPSEVSGNTQRSYESLEKLMKRINRKYSGSFLRKKSYNIGMKYKIDIKGYLKKNDTKFS